VCYRHHRDPGIDVIHRLKYNDLIVHGFRSTFRVIFLGFRRHPEAIFELEVFDGSAGDEDQAAFLHGGLQAPGRGSGGQQWAHAHVGGKRGRAAPDVGVPLGAPAWAGAGKAEAARPAAVPSLKPVPVATADQAAEITRLRRACDRLRMERDILKKSISIFAGPLR
jgi:hypothetical protein